MTLPDCTAEHARESLRAVLRQARRSVPDSQRARAARRVALSAARVLRLRRGWRIGLYAALPEEIDTSELIAVARRRGCRVYLPRIDTSGLARSMLFAQISARMRHNRFGIAEPHGPALPDARALHIIFLPLVGFDRRGTRLGMGGGYYDRALAFCRTRAVESRPLLVGLAYALQQREYIVRAAHDVPLDMVITERGVIRCTRIRYAP